MISFEIDYPDTKAGRSQWGREFSLNAYYAGKHWAVRKKDADYWHLLTVAALNKVPHGLINGPVEIRFYFNDKLDCSNHAAMAKMIEDALKGIVIVDDSPKYVQGMYFGFHDKPCIKVNVIPVEDTI